ncbi:putative ankyrin repeat protein [Phaeomoniella chlamydospora]|uniref:Putative ankyrin repeat protein n=1 Tax=Phaeomoniella chlamydospora TaxID=158046 RepID=A0A0G2EYC8_PHACM|nr:putative ankyrin repeat protein [Phaeomoniella chlamydospora]
MVPEGSNSMRYAKQGNLEKLKLSMKLGESTLWDTAPDGWSLLHTAVYARQLPMVKYLCEEGADTNASDLGSRRPVDLAILKSFAAQATKVEKEIVRVLSKEEDFLIDFEFTPIHIAVLDLYDPTDSERPGLEELIDFVDDANNAKEGEDWSQWRIRYKKRSPLFLAVIEQFRVSAIETPNTQKVIHNLLDQKDRKFHWTPLHWASSMGRADKMKILIDAGADPFITSNLDANIVHAAVESNSVESLAYSLKIANDHPTCLKIDHPNVWGESPLIMAAQGCLVECVRLLLEAGADKDVRQENGQVALHYAGLAKRGSERWKTVALLCSSVGGSDGKSDHINAQDEDGRPPIFDFLDDKTCIELLISHGARLDLHDKGGKNILHQACIQGGREQLEFLLQVSNTFARDLTEKDLDGNTPLMEALRHDSVSCARTLLELPDVGEVVGQGGWSAVHHAARIGDPELLQMVLEHPSFERGAKTGDGKSVQVVAMESGNWCGKVKELLRRHNSIA